MMRLVFPGLMYIFKRSVRSSRNFPPSISANWLKKLSDTNGHPDTAGPASYRAAN